MAYANIEYLSKDGNWHAYSTLAFWFGESLVEAITELASWFDGASTEWRIRIRH